MHYFASDVGFTNIVVRLTGQSGAETTYGVPTVQGQCLVTLPSYLKFSRGFHYHRGL